LQEKLIIDYHASKLLSTTFRKNLYFFVAARMPPPFIFRDVRVFIAHNVPAVYDVFASPIKETVGFQGLQKCGWNEPWEAQPT
jgi:hypothetical protein